jgi:hypothetical protein
MDRAELPVHRNSTLRASERSSDFMGPPPL